MEGEYTTSDKMYVAISRTFNNCFSFFAERRYYLKDIYGKTRFIEIEKYSKIKKFTIKISPSEAEKFDILYWGNGRERVLELVEGIVSKNLDENRIFLVFHMNGTQLEWFEKNRIKHTIEGQHVEVFIDGKKYFCQFNSIYPETIDLQNFQESLVVLDTTILHD